MPLLSMLGLSRPSKEEGREKRREQVRDWQRRLRSEQRQIERDVRKLELEEGKIEGEIRNAAQRQDLASCKILARELARSRHSKDRMNECKVHMNSISLALRHNVATARLSENLESSTEIMAAMNDVMKAGEVSETMRTLATEMAKMGLIEDMTEDAISGLDADGIEEDAEAEVAKVLKEFEIDINSQLPPTATGRPEAMLGPRYTAVPRNRPVQNIE